ncbi:MAG: 5'/3'-nucleotidase SurE [Spirochaetaceae bacterium 4572_59]|nr:MAG: 5'/3'-nucleotidase SurE [Spirochaetaceae bacterium 4572_59]
MKILITNDDGINSPGLQNLKEVLSKDHDVWVMAPSGDRSGSSQSITLKDPVKIESIEDQVWSCSGTPTDCIVFGTGGFLPEDLDVVLSGINLGPNLGTDLLYSGTAAAARQAALHNFPAIAVSLDKFRPPYCFQDVSEFVASHLEELVNLWEENCFLNMNFPEEMDDDTHLEWTWPARRIYDDELVKFTPPRGEGTYCFLKGSTVSSQNEEGSDVLAIKRGNVSISAVCVSPLIIPHVGKLTESAGYSH